MSKPQVYIAGATNPDEVKRSNDRRRVMPVSEGTFRSLAEQTEHACSPSAEQEWFTQMEEENDTRIGVILEQLLAELPEFTRTVFLTHVVEHGNFVKPVGGAGEHSGYSATARALPSLIRPGKTLHKDTVKKHVTLALQLLADAAEQLSDEDRHVVRRHLRNL